MCGENKVVVVLFLILNVNFFKLWRGRIVNPVPENTHLAFTPRTDLCRCAGVVGVHGEVVDVQAIVFCRFEEQGQICAPVGGNDRVCARGCNFGNVRGKVTCLCNGNKVIAHNLNVRTFACKVLFGCFGHLTAMRVILIDQVNLLDVFAALEIGGERFNFHFA